MHLFYQHLVPRVVATCCISNHPGALLTTLTHSQNFSVLLSSVLIHEAQATWELYACHHLLSSRVTLWEYYPLQSINLPGWWGDIRLVSFLNTMSAHVHVENLTKCWTPQLHTCGFQKWRGPKLSWLPCSFNPAYILYTLNMQNMLLVINLL